MRKVWRLLKKGYYKLVRSKGTPYSIAMGVAVGMFSGVIIPFGQFVPALLIAWLLRGNKIVAIAATFISNPYTTPFLYPFMCILGAKIIGIKLGLSQINAMYKDLTSSFSWHKFFNIGGDLLLAYTVGAAIIGIILAFAGYIITYRLIIISRERKAEKRRQKREQRASNI